MVRLVFSLDISQISGDVEIEPTISAEKPCDPHGKSAADGLIGIAWLHCCCQEVLLVIQFQEGG
jgi:hypothetical protein